VTLVVVVVVVVASRALRARVELLYLRRHPPRALGDEEVHVVSSDTPRALAGSLVMLARAVPVGAVDRAELKIVLGALQWLLA
jgi:hypothetical protein